MKNVAGKLVPGLFLIFKEYSLEEVCGEFCGGQHADLDKF